jgi:hypothetical protein
MGVIIEVLRESAGSFVKNGPCGQPRAAGNIRGVQHVVPVQFYGGGTVMLRSAVVLGVLLIGVGATMAAEQPPQLNVGPSCDAAAAHGLNGRNRDACMKEENDAKAALNDKWKDFNARQHARCTDLVRMGGPPSYVEILTCLEMAEQARRIPDRDPLKGTAGMGTFKD